MTDNTYDVVVLGIGSAGEYVASALVEQGRSVVAVESALLGGECPFLACIPSKVLLQAASRARAEGGDLRAAWTAAVARREEAVQGRDDSPQAEEMTGAGVHLLRGRGTVTAPGTVTVQTDDGEVDVHWREALLVGTGSSPVVPPLPGLDEVPTWTSDEALSSDDLPDRLLVLGAGAVGCELSQVYASFGVDVVLVETAATVLPAEDAWVGEALAVHLGRSGVDVRTGTSLVSVRPGDAGGAVATLEVDDREEEVEVDRVLVVTGRAPNGGDLGLEDVLGVTVEKGAVHVDDRLRALDGDGEPVPGVYAMGDVTGISPYTHTANHHARVVLANLAGRDSRTRHAGIPRGVYTEPPVYAVGLSEEAARKAGHDVLTAEQDVTETSRAFVRDGDQGPGAVRLVVDRDGMLLGAAAIGPEADSWGGELALAVTAGLDVQLLSEHVRAFPTWSEAITPAALDLAERVRGGVS